MRKFILGVLLISNLANAQGLHVIEKLKLNGFTIPNEKLVAGVTHGNIGYGILAGSKQFEYKIIKCAAVDSFGTCETPVVLLVYQAIDEINRKLGYIDSDFRLLPNGHIVLPIAEGTVDYSNLPISRYSIIDFTEGKVIPVVDGIGGSNEFFTDGNRKLTWNESGSLFDISCYAKDKKVLPESSPRMGCYIFDWAKNKMVYNQVFGNSQVKAFNHYRVYAGYEIVSLSDSSPNIYFKYLNNFSYNAPSMELLCVKVNAETGEVSKKIISHPNVEMNHVFCREQF